ncbi:MAG: hypothetical protein JNK49_19790 [Planctomycetes bacterium]|nr:hypothetical protein [Planctomycetota bacterium]
MNTSKLLSVAVLFAASHLPAQGFDFLFTTSQNERTLSGSGGTVLRDLHPNDIVGLPGFPCPRLAEKWVPRSALMTMAGDEDNDNNYWEPNLMGSIDALLSSFGAAGSTVPNARTIWYSPSVPLGTTISGGAGLRPGDIGRIVRNTAGDGRVQYFIRMESINQALGLPLTTPIDVDAAAFGPNHGLYLSLDTDIVCSPCGGPTLLRDGDVFCIPPAAYTLSAAGTIGGVLPNSAVVVYTEAQMDAFVANALVTNRFGVCVSTAIDTESLDIDFTSTAGTVVPTCLGVPLFVPTLLFSTESLTGGAILTTAAGGQIHTSTCAALGTSCGSGPTLGNQLGLLPPSASTGIPSYVNALASTRLFTYTAESVVHQIPIGTAAQIDFNTPGFMGWVFLTFAPMGPGVVAPSSPFVWGLLGHPDYYLAPNFMNTVPGGFATYTSPVIPFACDLVFQGVTITSAGTIEASTPTMIEVF